MTRLEERIIYLEDFTFYISFTFVECGKDVDMMSYFASSSSSLKVESVIADFKSRRRVMSKLLYCAAVFDESPLVVHNPLFSANRDGIN